MRKGNFSCHCRVAAEDEGEIGKLIKKSIKDKEGLHLIDERFQVYVNDGIIYGLLMTLNKFPVPEIYKDQEDVVMFPSRPIPKDTKYLFKKDMSNFLMEELMFSMQPHSERVFKTFKLLRGNVEDKGSFEKFVNKVKKIF